MTVAGVRLLLTTQPTQPDPEEIAALENPMDALEVAGEPNTIEIRFAEDVPVDFQTIRDGKSFIVADADGTAVVGRIVRIPAENTVRWVGSVPLPGTVTLKGTGAQAIKSKSGESAAQNLDGEPRPALPSGNGRPGGDFTFKIARGG